jgi:hypothetical protein
MSKRSTKAEVHPMSQAIHLLPNSVDVESAVIALSASISTIILIADSDAMTPSRASSAMSFLAGSLEKQMNILRQELGLDPMYCE